VLLIQLHYCRHQLFPLFFFSQLKIWFESSMLGWETFVLTKNHNKLTTLMLALTCFWGSYLFSVLDKVVYALNLLSLEQCCEAKRGKKKHQATSIMNYLTRRNDENIMHEHQTLDFISTDSSIVIEFLVFSMPSVLFMWKNTAVFLKTMKICCIWKWKIWREMLNFYFLWLSFISHHVHSWLAKT